MEEGEAMSLEGVRRGLSGSHLPRPPIRWRQVHRQAEPLQWHQKAQTLEDSHGEQDPWGEGEVLLDVGFGLRNHAEWEFSLGPVSPVRGAGGGAAEKRAVPILLPTPPQPSPRRSGCGDPTWPLWKVPGQEVGRPARGEGQECGRGHGETDPARTPGQSPSHPPPGAAGAQRMTQKRVLW